MPVILLDDDNFRDKIKSEGKVIIKYFADWCGQCRLISPKFKRLSSNTHYKSISFCAINADNSPMAREEADILTLPFFVVYKDGKLVNSISSSKEENIIALLQEL